MAGGLEQGSWGLGRVSKGLGAGAWRGPRGWGPGGGGWTLRGRPDGRTFARSFGQTDGRKIHPSVQKEGSRRRRGKGEENGIPGTGETRERGRKGGIGGRGRRSRTGKGREREGVERSEEKKTAQGQ